MASAPQAETGLPATDPVRFDPAPLVAADRRGPRGEEEGGETARG